MKVCVAQLLKCPEHAPVKTRLKVSPSEAVDIHCRLARHTARIACSHTADSWELWSTHRGIFASELAGPARHFQQPGGDLGTRMRTIVIDGLSRADAVILIGSDCPGIDHGYFDAALRLLRSYDAVVGPAEDGGYVLLALKCGVPQVFEGVDWGSDRVLAQTETQASAAGISLAKLPPRYDVDRWADWERALKDFGALGRP